MKKKIEKVLIMILGNAVLALGTAAFVVPNGLISGGVTGIGLILEHFFGLPVDVGVFVGDAVLFLLGAAVMGKAFAATIILSTIVYPTFFSLFGKIPFLTSLTDDKLMAAIYAGLLMGAGIGLVIKVGGSTGGMDIPPIILHKLFGGYPKFQHFVNQCHERIERHGGRALFICRLIPVLRTIVSIPAGLLKVPVHEYTAWSAAGIACWNTALIICGYFGGNAVVAWIS